MTISGIAEEVFFYQSLTSNSIFQQQSSPSAFSLEGNNNTPEIRFKISLNIPAAMANP